MASLNTVRLSASPRGISAAAGILRAGGLVAFPTETVYGLGADARSDRAARSIYEAKGRPSHNPLIAHVSSLKTAENLAEFPPLARRLAEAFWPGPLTLILAKRPEAGLSEVVTAGGARVGLRVPAHPTALALLEAFGGPLAAPSANRSGAVSPTEADHVLEGLSGRIDAVLDAGPCVVGLESTILLVEGGEARLLRPGGLALEDLESVAGGPILAEDEADESAPLSPGRLKSHYAPRAGLRLDAAAPAPGEAWLGFGPDPAEAEGAILRRSLSEGGDLREAAARRFARLREMDKALAALTGGAGGFIAVAPLPEGGLGRALNDRLRRAAAPRPKAHLTKNEFYPPSDA